MELIKLSPEMYLQWDSFVDEAVGGSIYSKSSYLDCGNFKYEIFAVIKNNRIIAGTAIVKNELSVCSNPIFVKHLGILYEESRTTKINKFITFQHQINEIFINELFNKIGVYKYIFHPDIKNLMMFLWKNYSLTPGYTYQFNFKSLSNNNIQLYYNERTKRYLKISQRNHLLICPVSNDDFYNVIKKTYSFRKTPVPFSKNFFVSFTEKLSKCGLLHKKAVIDNDGNVHAVAAIIYDSKSANLILNGSDPQFRKYGGNVMIIDNMINFAKSNSGIFDFEGSMHQRIESFYRGFGAELVSYFTVNKNNCKTKCYDFLINIIKKYYK